MKFKDSLGLEKKKGVNNAFPEVTPSSTDISDI